MLHDLVKRGTSGGQTLDEVLFQVCQDLRLFENSLRLWEGWLVYFLFSSFRLCSLCGSQPKSLGNSSACHFLVVHELYFCPQTPRVSTSWLFSIFFQSCIVFVDWLFSLNNIYLRFFDVFLWQHNFFLFLFVYSFTNTTSPCLLILYSKSWSQELSVFQTYSSLLMSFKM